MRTCFPSDADGLELWPGPSSRGTLVILRAELWGGPEAEAEWSGLAHDTDGHLHGSATPGRPPPDRKGDGDGFSSIATPRKATAPSPSSAKGVTREGEDHAGDFLPPSRLSLSL